MTYFISGHRDITEEEFNRLYKPEIIKALDKPDSAFVVGDYWGADKMAQTFLSEQIKDKTELYKKVTVYHMYDKPNIFKSNFFIILNKKGQSTYG